MKKFYIFIVMCFLGVYASGQTISSYVIASAGESAEADGISISWTLGELAIETFETSDIILTQGFQQGYFEVTSVGEPLSNNFDLKVFPNPATEYVMVELQSDEIKDGIIQMYDMNGRLVYNEKFNVTQGPNRIELSDLSSSQYILKVSNSSGEVLQTFKLIKR
ncbi:MAG: T9SS type A sorting domain-containing protein [Bacteroidetes bacterium]|nr:T9SS type A sorting domain-containing protein [Bacteroidota bacterium]